MYLAEKLDPQPRYAIYYSPEAQTPLWSLGTGWIGRDALADRLVEPRHAVAVTELERQALTATPAHYLSLIHISEPTRQYCQSRIPSSA